MICAGCPKDFTPTRPHQRFCSRKCRNDWNNAGDGGLAGAVSRVSLLKGGKVSVVITFTPLEREQALKILPGTVVEIACP